MEVDQAKQKTTLMDLVKNKDTYFKKEKTEVVGEISSKGYLSALEPSLINRNEVKKNLKSYTGSIIRDLPFLFDIKQYIATNTLTDKRDEKNTKTFNNVYWFNPLNIAAIVNKNMYGFENKGRLEHLNIKSLKLRFEFDNKKIDVPTSILSLIDRNVGLQNKFMNFMGEAGSSTLVPPDALVTFAGKLTGDLIISSSHANYNYWASCNSDIQDNIANNQAAKRNILELYDGVFVLDLVKEIGIQSIKIVFLDTDGKLKIPDRIYAVGEVELNIPTFFSDFNALSYAPNASPYSNSDIDNIVKKLLPIMYTPDLLLSTNPTEIEQYKDIIRAKATNSFGTNVQTYVENISMLNDELFKAKLKEIREAEFFWKRLKKLSLKILSYIEFGSGLKSSLDLIKGYITSFFSKPTKEKDSQKRKDILENIIGVPKSSSINTSINNNQWDQVVNVNNGVFKNILNLDENFWGSGANSFGDLLKAVIERYTKAVKKDLAFNVEEFYTLCIDIINLYPTPFIDASFKKRILKYAEDSSKDDASYGYKAFSNYSIIVNKAVDFLKEKIAIQKKINDLTTKLEFANENLQVAVNDLPQVNTNNLGQKDLIISNNLEPSQQQAVEGLNLLKSSNNKSNMMSELKAINFKDLYDKSYKNISLSFDAGNMEKFNFAIENNSSKMYKLQNLGYGLAVITYLIMDTIPESFNDILSVIKGIYGDAMDRENTLANYASLIATSLKNILINLDLNDTRYDDLNTMFLSITRIGIPVKSSTINDIFNVIEKRIGSVKNFKEEFFQFTTGLYVKCGGDDGLWGLEKKPNSKLLNVSDSESTAVTKNT